MCGSLAQLVEHLPYKQAVIGSSPIIPTNLCGSGSVVERCLAKANVASSNLVFRSSRLHLVVFFYCIYKILHTFHTGMPVFL